MAASAPSESLFGIHRGVIALGIARMADALGNSFLIIVLPLYVASESVSGGALGLPSSVVSGVVLALFGIVSSLTQPLAGHFSDRLGRRRAFVLAGLGIFCIANFSFSLASSYPALFLIRAVQGFAAAFTITASVALVSELSIGGGRGQNMGVYNSFRLVGFGGGPLLAGLVLEHGPYTLPGGIALDGFTACFYIAAAAALVSTVLVVAMVEDPETTKPTHRSFAIPVRGEGQALDPVFSLGLATFMMTGCIALMSSIEPEVNARLNQGPVLFAIQFATFIGALAVVQPLVGRASDTYGRRTFILIGLAALAPTTLAQGLVTTPAQMIGARLLQGISGALIFAPALALAGDLAKEGEVASRLSVLTVAFGLGISFGQITAGILVQYGFVMPFAMGALLALTGVGLVYTQVHEPVPDAEVAPHAH
ncbi:MAG: MFS transporter [Longimonas sp.]|uniref:MFS transporter n=1 Tax=Longimonas sp. TaxID=2039626 RepID=UPI003976CAB7